MVEKKGPYCDVVARCDRFLAVVEVKSPAEKSVVRKYDDTRGLSPDVIRSLPADFGKRRVNICSAIPRYKGCGLIKLYSVSVACQLLRYLHEYSERSNCYASVVGGVSALEVSVPPELVAYFVVPIEMKSQAIRAFDFLRLNGYISNYSGDTDRMLYVARIRYP